MATKSAASLYAKWKTDREPFLRRARDCSALTIPTLLPPDGHSSASDLPTPWQSIGARGVNNLAAKMLMSLFPVNSPFFKYSIDDFTLEELTQAEGMRAKVEEGLNKIERAVQAEVEASALRVAAFEALKHLIAGGNSLLFLTDTGLRVFHLHRYVVRRDPMGNVLDIIVEEEIDRDLLPATMVLPEDSGRDKDEPVKIYTWVKRNGKIWNVHQEVKDLKVPGSEGTYPLDKSPWLPVRFTKIDGENYGRGYVEEYLGDLKSLEGLQQAIVEGAAAAAKILFLVNPNGVTDMDDLADAENGAFREGMESDVSVLQLQKYNDFRVAAESVSEISARLSYAFLLNSAVQRNGERVTAEEIRYVANELDAALGGIYALMSQELQLPLVKRLIYQMERQKRLPVLPTKAVKPVIVTGLEAIGRGNDLTKLEQFIAGLEQIPQAAQRINWGDYITRRGTALGMDLKGLIKSDEQVAQEEQAAQQAAMLQQGLSPAINQAGQLMKQGMSNGQNPAQS
ncbi:portal protein [Pseudoduganella lutea]|uniref:Phage tail protein n=1 Tax=Pseudoduganella lutea TaxID=321985 RepID=A0A4P6L5V2_9BURK|nr:portal protein [Pseudoduganella lutea]QBE66844.1 phage tail protein [Pseudoduganella lutea]